MSETRTHLHATEIPNIPLRMMPRSKAEALLSSWHSEVVRNLEPLGRIKLSTLYEKVKRPGETSSTTLRAFRLANREQIDSQELDLQVLPESKNLLR